MIKGVFSKILIRVITLCLAFFSYFATANITSIRVLDGIVYFSLSQSQNTPSLSCISASASYQWAFSLEEANGRNLYRALLTADSLGNEIDVVSSLDCRDADGIERPLSISVSML